MTTAELLDIFTPKEIVPRDPFHGWTREEYEARQEEKQEIRKRQRALKALAADPQTPNRETWHCSRCWKTFARGEAFYLYYEPSMCWGTLKCQSCADEATNDQRVPIRQVTLVREIL